MRKLVLHEVAADNVVDNQSYLVLLADGDFVNAIAGEDKLLHGDMLDRGIPLGDAMAIFEAPRKNDIFMD